MHPLALATAALALFNLVALWSAFTTHRRLVNLRANCSVRNERGHVVRYANASPQVQARVETSA